MCDLTMLGGGCSDYTETEKTKKQLRMISMVTAGWQFSDPPNVAVVASQKIVLSGGWIAYVSHDSDDGAWQFHTSQSESVSEEDAMVVSLQSIVMLDPTVIELADLPLGWHAWRSSKSSVWQRKMM